MKELDFPRIMLVSNDLETWHKRKVYAEIKNKFIAVNRKLIDEELKSDKEALFWNYAKEINSDEVLMSKKEIASKIGIHENVLNLLN